MNNPKLTAEAMFHEQHVAVSKSINRALLVLIGFSLFCILTLGAEDASLLRTDATITMPFANTRISFVAFLIIGPAVLIALTIYLHVLVGYWNKLGGRDYKYALPPIQNIQTLWAVVFSGYLLYWLTPTVLAVFAWKALPRPEGPWLIIIASIVSAILAGLQIYRQKTRHSKWSNRIWMLVPTVLATLSIIQGYYQARYFALSYYQLEYSLRPISPGQPPPPNLFEQSALDPVKRADTVEGLFPRGLFERRLQLGHANLSNQTISSIAIRNGNLSSANLSKSAFVFTDLSNATLSGANLAGSSFSMVWLNDADLSYTNLTDARFVIVSLLNARLTNADFSRSQLSAADFQGADLAGAQFAGSFFRDVDLRNADLSNANFRDSKGLTCKQLTQAKRWWEAARSPHLGCGRTIPTTVTTLNYAPPLPAPRITSIKKE